MSRQIPELSDPQPTYSVEYHSQIRGWLELMTNSNLFTQIDWTAYQTVLTWASQDGYRPIVEQVIKARLGTTGPSAYKTLPPSSLVSLMDQLKKHVTPPEESPPSHLNIIAQGLLDIAEKTKAENDAQAEKAKWEAWCSVYGKPSGEHNWPGLPKEMEWGMWGLVWVPVDEWWKVPEQKKD